MSSLLESRWASLPEPSHEKEAQGSVDVDLASEDIPSPRWADSTPEEPRVNATEVEKPNGGISASRWADSPEPADEVVEPTTGLQTSRWAEAPEPETGKDASEKAAQDAALEVPEDGPKAASEDAFLDVTKDAPEGTSEDSPKTPSDTTPEDVVQEGSEDKSVDVPTERIQSLDNEKSNSGEVVQETVNNVNSPAVIQDLKDQAIVDGQTEAAVPFKSSDAEKQQPAPVTYLEPPRLKKRVSWRGKAIPIVIPRIDYSAAGLKMPLSDAEVQKRLQQFEDAGYNIHGHDLFFEDVTINAPAQARDIYPDETESRASPTKANLKVLLPDLEKWRSYTDWLTEQKLAALGVTLGFDEPAAPPSQDMSRQSSNQYPPLPFSPPIPSTSAGSIGRPGMIRGHSHTMSMAAPISPLNSPFGHMHRHSTVGGPTGFSSLQQLQQPQQLSPGIPGLSSFSPQQQFGLGGLPRVGSPAQITALRQDLGNMRGPGSPLSQQILPQSPQDYSRGMVEDQRRRQHAYSQSMYQPSMQSAFMSHGSSVRPTPVLPELPEDEDEDVEEEEEIPQTPETPAYVPPQKRVHNTEIAIPTPRGHRHNISEGLERELLEAEQRQESASRDWMKAKEGEGEVSALENKQQLNHVAEAPPPKPAEKDPLGAEHPVLETTHTRKKSASRLNVAAPAFTFNPSANFQPSASFQATNLQPPQTSFTFGAAAPNANGQQFSFHNRHRSSGSFNAAAPAFKPATSEFSFSANGPSFKPAIPQTEYSKDEDQNIVDELPSIFGKVQIPDIVKPAKRSKAVAIVRPDEHKESSGESFEDEMGRVTRGNAKRKQQRKEDDDGDQVPLFENSSHGPTPFLPPPDKILGSNDEQLSTVDEIEAEVDEALDSVAEKAEETIEAQIEEAHKQHTSVHHGHKHSTSLSALAKPFEPPFQQEVFGGTNGAYDEHDSISDLEEGEIREDSTPLVSPVRSSERDSKPNLFQPGSALQFQTHAAYPSNISIGQSAQPEPSFDEIDAVMRQLNANESEKEPEKAISPVRLPSPGSHPMKGVTYLPDSSYGAHEHTDSGDGIVNGWSQVRQLNKAEEVPTSDWSGILSPPDEEKFEQRSHFFDSHIDKIIGRVVEQRLQPLEESLKNIHSTFNRRTRSSDLKLQRTSSNVESDADDEDDLSDERKRPISRGRDKRVDQIKNAVLEALREQSPQRSQPSIDMAELHSVLAAMKVSFANAASSSLELDDIRAVVEDSLNRQSQAVVPATTNEHHEAHKRELSELQGRLNETLAGALEEANHRRTIEEREAESRRQLRLAEEELQIVRETARDEESKTRAMEQERLDLIERLERAEKARYDAEEKLEDSEAGKDALQATLEEYRKSSNKWRQDIDEGKRVRDELEQTLAEVERQNEDYHESSIGLKRRLQRLHSDMATAAGQLASDKAVWRSREEDYRAKIETLESQRDISSRGREQLEDELRSVRAQVADAVEVRHSVDQMRVTNNSLDETVRKLQAELTEQQALAVRYERQFHEAQESGRIEVHRTRMSLEAEVEAANHHVNAVRAELDAELTKARMELENSRMEAETAKARNEHLLEEEETVRREALRKVNHSNSVALDEARHKYETAIQDLTTQQTRAISNTLEDKQRMETFLNEKLALSEAKLQHYQERVSHLEERLEVARSAAQAAVVSAKAVKSLPPPAQSIGIPEKVSPQALRESILVLQEQLQERESRIERLQVQLEEEGPAKIKERDTEINWLRELLAVRSEELTDLVNTISRPNFDRASVRDTAIRIRANLDMEQQEKERYARSSNSLSGQALASLSSFATPKAVQLTSAFNKWRTTMESSALKSQAHPGGAPRSDTPSKAAPRRHPPGYHSGLMTPPASNLRSSPSADETKSLPPPRLHPRTGSRSSGTDFGKSSRPRSRHASGTSERSNTALFREQSYDRDAPDHSIHMENFEDDDLEDVEDSEPPAFRSLEDELDESSAISDSIE